MACGWDRVYHHLQGAKTSLKLSVGGICWWDLDCKGTWASAACLVSLPLTQLAPAALGQAARARTQFSCLSDNAHYHSCEPMGSSASESGQGAVKTNHTEEHSGKDEQIEIIATNSLKSTALQTALVIHFHYSELLLFPFLCKLLCSWKPHSVDLC